MQRVIAVASIACNIAQSHWMVPAKWMYYYLLDADWASNSLSWQWVAGSNSNKKYFANQQNINKYCFTNQSDTFLDIGYSEFQKFEIPEVLKQTYSFNLKTPLPVSSGISIENSLPTVLYNFYNLDPDWKKNIKANKILILEPSHFEEFPVCQNSIDFALKIAKENNVSETAFFIKKDDHFYLRWFTPEIEMDLCGHATLATAYCLKKHMNFNKDLVKFDSMSGELMVKFDGDYMQMDFPHRKPTKSDLPQNIMDSLSIKPREILKSRDYVLVYENEDQIKDIQINKELFDKKNIDPGGVVITSISDKADFVSRYFVPQCSFFEDPVTGSTHCSLVPYWSEKLKKSKLKCIQLSERGGEMICEDLGNRVLINGKAVTYSEGYVHLKY